MNILSVDSHLKLFILRDIYFSNTSVHWFGSILDKFIIQLPYHLPSV